MTREKTQTTVVIRLAPRAGSGLPPQGIRLTQMEGETRGYLYELIADYLTALQPDYQVTVTRTTLTEDTYTGKTKKEEQAPSETEPSSRPESEAAA